MRVTGRRVEVVNVIGGGVRNELLCRLTADVLGRPVLAGPVEATALGNVLVQARATRDLGRSRPARGRDRIGRPNRHEPAGRRDESDALYGRFLEVTGLTVDEPEPAIA